MSWTRNDRLVLLGVVVALLTLVAGALVVPEVRRFFALDNPQVATAEGTGPSSEIIGKEGKNLSPAQVASSPVAKSKSQDVRETTLSALGFTVRFKGCRDQKPEIVCKFSIDNPRETDAGIAFHEASAIDDQGVDYVGSSLTFGNNSTSGGSLWKIVPAKTNLRASIVFFPVADDASAFALLRIPFNDGTSTQVLEVRDVRFTE